MLVDVGPRLARIEKAVVVGIVEGVARMGDRVEAIGVGQINICKTLERIGDVHVGQRDVAGVAHLYRIVDDIAGLVGMAIRDHRCLVDSNLGIPRHRYRGVVGVGVGLVGVRSGGVVDIAIVAAVAVNLRLRQRVLRGVAPGLAHLQQIVAVADYVGAANDRAQIRVRVGHLHTGQRDVAGVLHRDRVVELLARHVGGLARNSLLDNVQRRVPRHRYRGVVGVGVGLVGVRSGGVVGFVIVVAVGFILRIVPLLGG